MSTLRSRRATLAIAVATTMSFAFAGVPVQAGECRVIAAAGNGPTQGIAELMSTKGLGNIIEGKGLKGTGPVKTKCEAGTFMTECRSQQMACK